jgi:hypothetical protein
MSNYHQTKDRLLKAYIAYDELKSASFNQTKDRLLKAYGTYDELKTTNFHQTKDRHLKATVSYDDSKYKIHAASINIAQLVYQNRREAINSAIQAENILMQHYANSEDRDLKAYSVYDELQLKNHWSYFETLIRQYVSLVQSAVDFIKSKAYNPDQLTFNNWLAMSKVMAEGQLRIAAMVSNLMPGGSTT